MKLSIDISKIDYFDTEITGFMLEVRKSTKTFYYRYSKDSKRTMHKLGNADTMTADEARRLTIKMKKAIATDSLETMFVKKSRAITLKSFYEDVYLPHIKLHNKSWKHNVSTYTKHILPVFGNHAMNEITSHEIAKAHSDMIYKKKLMNGTANKLIFFLRQTYKMAIDMKIEGVTENPAVNVKKLEELHRERYITRVDVQALMKAAIQSKNQLLQYIIPFLLLTGARKNEVLRARWRDIDLDKLIWTIPITKNKKVRKLPISNELNELLKKIPNTSEFIFPSPNRKTYLHLCYKTWDTVRIKAGLHDLRIHDLRHSYASMLVNSGRSIYEVQTLLGHADTKMTQRYAHLNNESLLAATSCAGKLLG